MIDYIESRTNVSYGRLTNGHRVIIEWNIEHSGVTITLKNEDDGMTIYDSNKKPMFKKMTWEEIFRGDSIEAKLDKIMETLKIEK